VTEKEIAKRAWNMGFEAGLDCAKCLINEGPKEKTRKFWRKADVEALMSDIEQKQQFEQKQQNEQEVVD
jgi:hypothetical protein